MAGQACALWQIAQAEAVRTGRDIFLRNEPNFSARKNPRLEPTWRTAGVTSEGRNSDSGNESGHETKPSRRFVLQICHFRNTYPAMKTLTVRLPEALIAQIEAESRRRRLSKSDVVRERLTETKRSRGNRSALLDAVADVIGSVDKLPHDLSARKKKYLRSTGYGKKRSG